METAFCLGPALFIPVGIVVVWALSCIQILNEYERGVIFRFGRIPGGPKGVPVGPGLVFVFRPIDKIVRVSTRTITMDVPPQDIITKDNISVKVNAVVYFHVVSPIQAIIKVENFLYATSQLAQTTLRAVLGQVELDELLSQRDRINANLQEILDKHTDPWGVKVSMVEVKHIDLPPDMQRAMARQAEAERDRRGKVIAAEGEYQAAEKLAAAAEIIGTQPSSLQLRFLQTLVEVAAEKNSTILFPIPIDLFEPFMKSTTSKYNQPSPPKPAAAPPKGSGTHEMR